MKQGTSRKGRKRMSINKVTFARMMAYWVKEPSTVYEVADECGLNYHTVRDYFISLYREGIAHVHGWAPDANGRHSLKVWKFGPGKDAARPLRKDKNLSSREQYYKRRAIRLLNLSRKPANDSQSEVAA